jgi:thiol-disulfide isomerase/thioredoxin
MVMTREGHYPNLVNLRIASDQRLVSTAYPCREATTARKGVLTLSLHSICREVSHQSSVSIWRGLVCTVGVFMAAVTHSGCGRSSSTDVSVERLNADQVLRSMVDAYCQAGAYQDDAVVRLSYQRQGEAFQDEAPLAVAWQRPNQIHVEAYQVEVACNGTRFRARIKDQSTADFDGQVVDRVAPQKLQPGQFFEDDQVLSLALRQGLAGNPIQLDLLLSERPLSVLFEDNVKRQLLPPVTIENSLCYRVAVDSEDGRFVFSIDQREFLLRRMEYPATTFAPEIAQDPGVDDLSLSVELRGAAWKPEILHTAFEMGLPPLAKKVSQFIPPPRELPSKLFGTTTASYAFQDLSGKVVSSSSLKDRIKVLVWFNNHPACRSTIQQLNQVYQQYRGNAATAFFSVCVEPESVSNEQIQQLSELWQVDVPVVRDVEAHGRDLFQIPWAPTMVILDKSNTVQIVEIGANPNLVAELPQVLERLLAGEDLAAQILTEFRQQQEMYQQALKQGKPLVTETTAASKKEETFSPQQLKLRPLWSNHELQAPGNILAICSSDSPARFLVYEGRRTVAELNSAGEVIAKHQLDVAGQKDLSQLATAVDGEGKRYYAAWSLRGRQVHLFDADWRRLLSYPANAAESPGVQDVTFADLDADKEPELYVGFWNFGGVHATSLRGRVLWTSGDVSHVSSLMAPMGNSEPTRLQVTTAAGAVFSLDHLGRSEAQVNSNGQLVHHLFCGSAASRSEVPFCGISYGPEGRRLAVGLTEEFEPRWRYNLPAGSFPTQIKFVTSAQLFSSSEDYWLIAGPDGSLHLVSRDGKFTDHFYTDGALVGVAAGRTRSKSILLISSDQGVGAWEITPPETAQADNLPHRG